VVILGNDGGDTLNGGDTEDAIVDGPGNDSTNAAGGDDATPNNAGVDNLDAGAGDDLFVDDSACEGDMLDGGGGVDNANWAQFDLPVVLDLAAQRAGLRGPSGELDCVGSGEGSVPTTLEGLEDIEGTSLDDVLIGDAAGNQLLGRPGADTYRAADGNDSILANSGDSDPVIDCGEGFDTAQIDIPTASYQDAAPSGCEAIHERPPNSFRPPDTPPNPNPPTPEGEGPKPPPPPQARDTTPPVTGIRHRPRRILEVAHLPRRVAFTFRSEAGARFSCKLDGRGFAPCGSPRGYRVGRGRHVFRVFAIDEAGNRDRSPALFAFRVMRLSGR
jgi:hypothetical protein